MHSRFDVTYALAGAVLGLVVAALVGAYKGARLGPGTLFGGLAFGAVAAVGYPVAVVIMVGALRTDRPPEHQPDWLSMVRWVTFGWAFVTVLVGGLGAVLCSPRDKDAPEPSRPTESGA